MSVGQREGGSQPSQRCQTTPVSESTPTGEDRRDGAARKRCSDDHLNGGDHLRGAEARPHPAGVVARLEGGRNGADDEHSGDRSSSELRVRCCSSQASQLTRWGCSTGCYELVGVARVTKWSPELR